MRNISKFAAFTFGITLLWLGINLKHMVGKTKEKESRNSDEFEKWIKTTVGNLAKRKLQWNKYVDEEARRSHRKRLPDLIGIGVRKCGTGAIQDFLNKHPLVKALHSEPVYFSSYRDKGLDYYRRLLPASTESQIVAEKSPAYFSSRPENLPEIINKQVPGVKIWVTLCNPAARAFSDFAMRKRKARAQIDEDLFENEMMETLRKVRQGFVYAEDDFSEFHNQMRRLNVSGEEKQLFSEGMYAVILRRWLRVFPPDRFLIIDGEELFHDPGAVIEQFQEFLHIPKLLLRKDFVRHPKSGLYCIRPYWRLTYDFAAEYHQHDSWEDGLFCLSPNKGKTRSRDAPNPIPQRLKLVLERFYGPHNNMLYELLGRNFLWQ